jgi:site-specific DNA-methyltransferase (adenine-specific)
MSAELLVERDDVAVYHASWADLLKVLPRREDNTVCDALIVDAPYSERTHRAHDAASESAGGRRVLDYGAWSTDCVREFCEAWVPATRGWFVSITDHVLAPSWAATWERLGLYVFSPLACVQSGSRVRILGDGPAQWSTWAVVARPRTAAFAKWGALPGAYVVPPGHYDRSGVVGGKPLWLMERLVEDYTRPGELVCDPCCGGGRTLEAALRTGRRAVGGDAMREHAEIAADRCGRRMIQRPLFAEGS